MDPIVLVISADARQATESLKDFARETKATIDGGIVTSVEKAQRSFDDLGRKIKQTTEVINQAKQTQQQATQAEQEAIKKTIALHELEILKLQEKRTRVGEVISLSTAGSEDERKAIKGAVDDRIVAINGMKDQLRAQSGINDEVGKGTGLLDSYFGRFVTISGVIGSLHLMQQAFEGQREEIERIIAAVEHFKGMNLGQYNTYKPFFNEAGISGGAAQDRAVGIFTQMQGRTNLDKTVLSEAAAKMAPVLKEKGIAWDSAQGQSIIENAAILQDKGVDSAQIRNVASDMPNLTGGGLNSSVATTIAAAGSSTRANELLGAYYTNKEKAGAVGLGRDDITKMFMFLHGQKGETQEQIPQDIGRALQAMDRMVGLDPTERLALQQKLSEDGAGGLAAHMGNIPKFMAAFQQLSPSKREVVAREIAGPRGVVAMNAISGYGAMQLPSAGPLSAPDNLAAQGEAASQGVDARYAAAHPTSPEESAFTTALPNEIQALSDDPSKLPWYQRGWYQRAFGNTLTVGTTPSKNEIGAANIYGQRIVELARYADGIANGTIKATPQQAAQINSLLKQAYSAVETDNTTDHRMRALVNGRSDRFSRSSVLNNIRSQDDVTKFLSDNMSYYGLSTDVDNPHKFGKLFDQADQVEKGLPSLPSLPLHRPSTQPSTPTSINYHIRQTNYGYENSSIGAPAQSENNFG